VVELNDSQIYQEIGKIVNQFQLYQCYECAKAVMQWLTDNKIEGKVIELRTRYYDEDYIISAEGMTRENWLKDFHCQSEEFIITEVGE
jgi:hypothetical protein